MGKKFDMLALGEVLLRLSPEGNERLTQGTRFEKLLGGAELNVTVGAANLGLTAGVVSKIPSHAIGNYAKREIRRNGVDTDYLAGDEASDCITKILPIVDIFFAQNPQPILPLAKQGI